jgi:hypothetical protein
LKFCSSSTFCCTTRMPASPRFKQSLDYNHVPCQAPVVDVSCRAACVPALNVAFERWQSVTRAASACIGDRQLNVLKQAEVSQKPPAAVCSKELYQNSTPLACTAPATVVPRCQHPQVAVPVALCNSYTLRCSSSCSPSALRL